MRPLKKEIDAVAALLKQGADTPEQLAADVITTLDRARAERTTYSLVLRFGSPGNVFFQSFGPYSTINQAEKAFEKHPAAHMATGRAVVPCVNDIGLDELIARVDTPAVPKGDWGRVKADAAAFRRGEKPRP